VFLPVGRAEGAWRWPPTSI